MLSLSSLAAIGFGSGWMLLWAAAGGIPILIHFLTRRRHVQVKWGAMALLQEVVKREAKRVRLEQLLLLLLRVLILALLAIALAAPFITSSDSNTVVAEETKRTFWIICVDSSYSMGYRVDGKTRFELAQERALEILDNSQPGDAFALLEISSPSRWIIERPTYSQENCAAELQRMRLKDTSADAQSLLLRIDDLIAEAQESSEVPTDIRVAVLSDMGSDTWSSVVTGAGANLMRKIGSVASLDFASFAVQEPVNLAVTAIQSSANRGVVDDPLEVSVRAENASNRTARQVPIQLSADGNTLESKNIDIPAGSSVLVSFTFVPKNVGFVVLSASIPNDNLPADDERHRTIQIVDRNRILFAEDRANTSRLVRMSLDPKGDRTFSDREQTINTVDLKTTELASWDAIYLSDVAALDPTLQAQLVRYVRAGGAVIASFGPSARIDRWNALESQDNLLGFGFTRPSEFGTWTVDPLSYESPIALPFSGFPDAGLLTTPVFRYWMIEPGDDSNLTVDLGFTSGDAFVVRNELGSGWVASILSAPAAGVQGGDWNAIASWPSFVPLMQQIVKATLDTRGERVNLQTGQVLTGELAHPELGVKVTVVEPNGTENQILASDTPDSTTRAWRFAKTQNRGVYTVKDNQSQTTPYSVNVNPIESLLKSIAVEQLPATQRLADSPSGDVDAPDQPQATHNRIARVLLGLLLALLILESLAAWHLGRRIG